MKVIVLFLASLACAVLARRVQKSNDAMQRRQVVESHSKGSFDIVKALATLLVTRSPDAAFNPVAPGDAALNNPPVGGHVERMHMVPPRAGLLLADAVATDEEKRLKLKLRRKQSKDFFKAMKEKSPMQLWYEEAPKFEELSRKERDQQVGLIRAVGLQFASYAKLPDDKEMRRAHEQTLMEVRCWLEDLLEDPSEKVRCYAIDALAKVGGDEETQERLLDVVQLRHSQRERDKAMEALSKIASNGKIVEDAMLTASGVNQELELQLQSRRASLEDPSSLVIDAPLDLEKLPGLRLILQSPKGSEVRVTSELRLDLLYGSGAFKPIEAHDGYVIVEVVKNFRLADLYLLRRFDVFSLILWQAESEGKVSTDEVARALGSESCWQIMRRWTRGSIRYRIEVDSLKDTVDAPGKLAAGAIAKAANDLNPEIHNDGTGVWSLAVRTRPTPDGRRMTASVELRPRLFPDPRSSSEFRKKFQRKKPRKAATTQRDAD